MPDCDAQMLREAQAHHHGRLLGLRDAIALAASSPVEAPTHTEVETIARVQDEIRRYVRTLERMGPPT